MFVPEEELGGMDGMRLFVHTEQFREMNVGFALDEGIGGPSPLPSLPSSQSWGGLSSVLWGEVTSSWSFPPSFLDPPFQEGVQGAYQLPRLPRARLHVPGGHRGGEGQGGHQQVATFV